MKKIFYLFIAFILKLNIVAAQEIEWTKTIGGAYAEPVNSIKQTADGGYIIGGFSNSNISGDKTENSNGQYDYWIVKTDGAGNVQWQNTIGGNADDLLYSIEQTTDGGYILGGYSSSIISGDKTENSNGLFDYWIVKIDSIGNIQWQNSIGGSGDDQLYSIQQTSDSGYILGGYSNSDISGDKTQNSYGGWDYWIVKTDASGVIQWQKTFGGNGWDKLYAIYQSPGGDYTLAGFSLSNISGNKTDNTHGGADYWIIKINAFGNIIWQKSIGGSGDEDLSSIQQTSDGGLILGGYSDSNISGDKTENSFGGDDYWIVKTDNMGNIQWQRTIGGNDVDHLSAIQETTDKGFILGGESFSIISGNKTENTNGQADYWIVKTDSSGNIQWQNTVGGQNWDEVGSIQQTSDGGLIVGGWSQSDISGDKTEKCIGSLGWPDYWLVKLTNKFNSINGNLFVDLNSNLVQDTGEPAVTYKTITEVTTGRFGFSDQNGDYSVAVIDTGNFFVSPNLINYYSTTPANQNAYFNNFYQTDLLNDFGFQPLGTFNDLCVSITPITAFRAGFNASYIISYENVGTTTLNGSIIFFFDNNLSYVSSNPSATSINLDSIVWNVGMLAPFQNGNILLTVSVNSTIFNGTLINTSVRIDPVVGDADAYCNYSSSSVIATGSYDPNVILVDRDTILTTELLNPPYLDYIIYFQNTGTDTAFNEK